MSPVESMRVPAEHLRRMTLGHVQRPDNCTFQPRLLNWSVDIYSTRYPVVYGSLPMTRSTPAHEKTLYDQFAELYDTLLLLKNDRLKYILSREVYAIYDQFLRLVHELSVVRKDEELRGLTLVLPTPTDLLIDDIWQLMSLSFMTCGLTKFAPATYSSLSTVYKLLTHLRECQVYTMDDLRPIQDRLAEIKLIIDRLEELHEESEHRNEEALLLRTKLNKCQAAYAELARTFSQIPLDLEPAYNLLIAVRKLILNYMTAGTSSAPEAVQAKAQAMRASLKEIEEARDEQGRFASREATPEQLERLQMVLNGLLDDCNNLLSDLHIQHDADGVLAMLEGLALQLGLDSAVAGFRRIYNELLAMKQTLEKLLVTRRWTMRETDLHNYQVALKRIDNERMELAEQVRLHPGLELQTIKRGRLVVLYLLRRCYLLIYKLLESLEPVLELLQPIHNQLLTVRRCLLEIKRVDGLNNLRELYPFQFKLALLDNLRHDGKFIVNNQVPEGQGTLNALLAECFDITHELKMELEEKEESHVDITDDEDKKLDDEVELKRNRYVGFHEADYDQESANDLSDDDSAFKSDYY